MNYTEPFLRKVETAQEEEEQQHHPQSGASYRAAVAANKLTYISTTKLKIVRVQLATIYGKRGPE